MAIDWFTRQKWCLVDGEYEDPPMNDPWSSYDAWGSSSMQRHENPKTRGIWTALDMGLEWEIIKK